MLRSIAASAVFALALAGGSAVASQVLATTDTPITTSNGYIISVYECGSGGVAGACPSGDTFSVSANGEGVTLTGGSSGGTPNNGSAPNIFESVTTGSVDTFVVFSITSPIQSITSVGISATGCGDNSGVTGCGATTVTSSAATTLYASTSSTFSSGWLGPSAGTQVSFGPGNPNATTISAVDDFSAVSHGTTVYVEVDLNAALIPSFLTGYASFDSVTLSVPEPASWAVLAFGLVGLGALRRRRRA